MGAPISWLDAEVGRLTNHPKLAGLAKFSDLQGAKDFKPK